MAILRILFRRGSSCRLRLMALVNVMACTFVVTMTLLTTAVSYFAIVPGIASPRAAAFHRGLIFYLFINVCGNFLLCVFVDTSTSRARKRPPRRTPPSRTLGSSSKRSSPSQKDAVSSNPEVKADGAKVSGVRGRHRRNPSDVSSRSSKSTTCDVSTGDKPGSNNLRPSKEEPSAPSGNEGVESSCKDFVSESPHEDKSEKIGGTTGNAETTEVREGKESESSLAQSPSKTDPAGCRVSSNNASASLRSGRATEDPRTEASPRTKTKAFSPKSVASPEPRASSVDQPERSHECKLCEKQILRRDHHCFFMTVCVGFHNHKHFIFFCLYMMIGALYGLVLNVRYLYVFYKLRFWGPQTFFFLIVEVMTNILSKGMVPTPFFAVLIFQLYVCLAVGLFAAGFLYWHVAITCNGQTTHEATSGDRRYSRGLANNLREVLGQYWPLLFLLPLPLPQRGDGWRYPATTNAAADLTPARPEEPRRNRKLLPPLPRRTTLSLPAAARTATPTTRRKKTTSL